MVERVRRAPRVDRREGVAAADDGEGRRSSAHARATARVPAANGSSSKTPIGPFHRIEPAPASASVKAATVAGPMSRPISPSGITVGRHDLGGRVRVDRGGRDHVDREVHRDAARPRGGQRIADLVEPVLSTSDAPTLPPSAAMSVNAIAPPITSASTRSASDVDHRRACRSPSRRRGSRRTAARGRAAACRAPRPRARRRRPATAERPEASISSGSARRRHAHGGPPRTRRRRRRRRARRGAGERDVVRLLPRVEPEVLQEDDVVVGQRLGGHSSSAVTGRSRRAASARPTGREPETRRPPGPWDGRGGRRSTRCAPRSSSSLAVGRRGADPASSAIAPSRNGTFMSARRNTRVPATSPSASRVRIVTG